MRLAVFASRAWLIMLDVNKEVRDLMIALNEQLSYVRSVIVLGMNYVVETYKESQ